MRNVNEFDFNEGTNIAVRNRLTELNRSRQRVRLYYGDTETGKSWCDEYETIGYIGKSTGIKPIPLMINNARSMGGTGILDHCIVGIQDVASKRFLYKHEKFDLGKWEVVASDSSDYPFAVKHDGKEHARFKTEKQASNYCKFMKGERMCK